MREIELVDEAIIDAGPAVVYQALVDELTGKTDWWSPHLEARPRGETPASQAGAIVDITVHIIGTPRFTAKTIEARENEMLRLQYVEGDFEGEGIWTFEPVGERTRVRFRWHVQPQRWLTRMLATLLAPFMDIGKMHSDVMKLGFEGLNRYVRQKKE